MTKEVTVKIKLIEDGLACDELIEQLGEAGLTEVMVGCGQLPTVALTFPLDRESLDVEMRLHALLGSTVLFLP